VLSATVAVVTMRLFVWPATDVARQADAIVILGPGRHGERFLEGERLIRDRIAPSILISLSSRAERSRREQQLCRAVSTTCFRARPFTTRGEAQAIAKIAQARRWRHIVLVTSRYHVTRARLLNDRCFDGRVDVVAADHRRGWLEAVSTTLHEWGGLIALTFTRGC